MSNFNTPAVMGSSWNVVKLNSAWLRDMQIFLFHIPINYRSTVSVFVLKCTITGDKNKPFFFQWLELTFLKYHITHLTDLKHAPIFTCVALVSLNQLKVGSATACPNQTIHAYSGSRAVVTSVLV